jgi:hypothetical protein
MAKKLLEMSREKFIMLAITTFIIFGAGGGIIVRYIAVTTGTASAAEGMRLGIMFGLAPAIGLVFGILMLRVMTREQEARDQNIRQIVREEIERQQRDQ